MLSDQVVAAMRQGEIGVMVMADHEGLPVVAFASRENWEAWLVENGAASPGIWLKFAKDSGSSFNLVRSIDFLVQFQKRGGGASMA